MFVFIIGFLMGGAAGAAIVLATSPQFQHQGENGHAPEASVNTFQKELKARVDGAIIVGKKAAAEKVSELDEMVKRRRGAVPEKQA